MSELFDAARHEPLQAARWDEDVARDAIARIVRAAHDDFEGPRWWPAHPLDEPAGPDERRGMLYHGAGGVIWALQHLAHAGAAPLLPDYHRVLRELPQRNRELLASWPGSEFCGSASYLMGDSGLLLLQLSLAGGDTHIADRLFDVVQGNLHHTSREALWGSPGSLLAALHMAEATGDARWQALFTEGVEILWSQMERDPHSGAWLWQQQLYGRPVIYLGAGHGFAGNVYPVLRGAALLPAAVVEAFTLRALQTLSTTAMHAVYTDDEGRPRALVAWHAITDPARIGTRLPITQDCHGAPGIVCRFADAPRTLAWDALLGAAAELVWHAGPLTKGAGLCHGTAGNGYALLKQWRRSGDELWLNRARAFAMHALAQTERQRVQHGMARHSLWTGDEGVALYLHACLSGDTAFPTLDVF